jgi:AraC-like DNA-binding protein
VSRPFAYHEHVPSTSVEGIVLSYWAFEAADSAAAPGMHTVWPDGCTSLAIVLVPGAPRTSVCLGATVEARRLPVTPGARYVGIRFWPDVGAACTGYPAALLRDAVLPVPPGLATSWAETAAQVERSAKLADVWAELHRWAASLAPGAAPDPLVRRAVQLVAGAGGDVRVAQVAGAVGCSARTLQRRFSAATGLTIKEYARIRRLRTALNARLQNVTESWSGLAAELGYADQSHLIREFVALAGLSPRDAEERLAAVAHFGVRP